MKSNSPESRQENTVLGIDGCRSGWIVAAIHLKTGDVQLTLFPHIQDVWQVYRTSCKLALLDMPIGLLDTGPDGRACDRLARRMLSPHRHSSIFTPPCRTALYASAEAASRINYQYTGKKLSRQTINIMPKMREIDTWLQSLPTTERQRIQESHPEIIFCALNEDQPLVYNKKKVNGREQRLALLSKWLPPVSTIVHTVRQNIPAKDAAWDDLIDALALALAAQLACLRPELIRYLPPIPEEDRSGLPMSIFYLAQDVAIR